MVSVLSVTFCFFYESSEAQDVLAQTKIGDERGEQSKVWNFVHVFHMRGREESKSAKVDVMYTLASVRKNLIQLYIT